MVELHRNGSAPAACAAGLFFYVASSYSFVNMPPAYSFVNITSAYFFPNISSSYVFPYWFLGTFQAFLSLSMTGVVYWFPIEAQVEFNNLRNNKVTRKEKKIEIFNEVVSLVSPAKSHPKIY